MRNIVVAYDLNRGIGADNDLLWLRDLPKDLARFKELTLGGAIIMGRKTYESIGRPLPGRQNIVLTRQQLSIAGVYVAQSLSEAYDMVIGSEIFVIGGGEIYEQAIEKVDRIYSTEVQARFPAANVFFPSLSSDWHEKDRQHNTADDRNLYDFDFVTYERI